MNRTTVWIVAWIGAAIVSMLIASAAVGAVRDNVSETPQPLTAALPPTTVTIATSGTPPATTVTTSPETPTTEPSTTAAPTPTSSTTTQPPPATGTIKTFTVTGGTVSIEVFPDHLTLLGAVPAAGFTVEEKNLSSTQIEIEFRSGERESKFSAAIEHGQLITRAEPHETEDD